MTKNIQHQFFFPHPPEVVWDYLTKPALIAEWLMPTDFEPIIGYDFRFTTKAYPNLNFDGIVYCKVLEIVPFKKLSYSWKGGPGEGVITLDSIVVWTLETKDEGTQLSLVHSGFKDPENAVMFSGMSDGWLKNIQKIAAHINTINDGSRNA